MTDLRKAAQAVLDRWDGPKWDWLDAGPTADLMKDLRAALAEPEQDGICKHCTDGCPACDARKQRKPLTDEKIKECERQAMVNGALPFEQRAFFARAIERAHGIGGEYER